MRLLFQVCKAGDESWYLTGYTFDMTDQNNTHIPVFETTINEPKKERGSVGSVLAILLIVTLLVVGAFYVWGQRVSEARATHYINAV